MASPRKPKNVRQRVINTALDMASERAWYDLTLHDIAGEAGISVNDLRREFSDTNAIADAWFAQALTVMLSPRPKAFAKRPTAERLELVLLSWFEAFDPHRRATRDMLSAKCHLPHVHHWVPMVFSLSHLVQMWRDAAGLRSGGRRRQIEETGLTMIFLATLAVWHRDDSDGLTRTRAYLGRRLAEADRAMAGLDRRTDNTA